MFESLSQLIDKCRWSKAKKPKNNPDVNDLEDSPVSPLSAQWPQAPKSFVDVSMLVKHSSEHNKQSIHEQILTPRQASQHPTHKVVLSSVVRYWRGLKQYPRHCRTRTLAPSSIISSSMTFLPPQRGESKRRVVRETGYVYPRVNPFI